MKLKDAIEWAKESPDRDWTDVNDLLDAAGFPSYLLSYYSEDETPFTEVDLVSWQCTDTVVGWSAILMDDDVVALSYRPYRKSSAEITWVPVNGADPRPAVRKWAVEQLDAEDSADQLVDLNEDIALTDVLVADNPDATLFSNVFADFDCD